MSKLIAVVDDEPDIVELITHHLKKEGFRTKDFYDGESLLNFVKITLPELIILDLMLPGIDGLEICRILKRNEKTSFIPVVMLTAKGTETDIVVGLELGADDYIVKPFSPRELVARVKTVLRRAEPKKEKTKSIKLDDLLIDLTRYEARVNNKKIDLTTTEFKILVLLAERPGWVLTRNQILKDLWEDEKIVLDRTIDVHIKNLREKLGEVGKLIKTIRGIGYKIEE
ncbi:response regulator transcription factor [Candidatus Aerophobetes bacterium]|nr:response regulator transcription factor [Candidatus Aerophobetes bacterium]